MHVLTCTRQSEDSLQESVLTVLLVGPRNGTRALMVDSKHLYHRVIPLACCLFTDRMKDVLEV